MIYLIRYRFFFLTSLILICISCVVESKNSINVCFGNVNYLDNSKKLSENCNKDTTEIYYTADSIKKIFELKYKVSIYTKWCDDSVLAGTSGDNIYITGGFLRNVFINKESLFIIFAHEIGHRYEGKCEAHSDYYGVKVVLRDLNIQDSIINLGILQLQSYFNSKPKNEFAGYPSNQCRIDTYKAALKNIAIPQCAIDYDLKHCKKH